MGCQVVDRGQVDPLQRLLVAAVGGGVVVVERELVGGEIADVQLLGQPQVRGRAILEVVGDRLGVGPFQRVGEAAHVHVHEGERRPLDDHRAGLGIQLFLQHPVVDRVGVERQAHAQRHRDDQAQDDGQRQAALRDQAFGRDDQDRPGAEDDAHDATAPELAGRPSNRRGFRRDPRSRCRSSHPRGAGPPLL